MIKLKEIIKETKFIDNTKLKEFPKRMSKEQTKLFHDTAVRALAYKEGAHNSKERFSASVPVMKGAKKYSVKQLENQIKHLSKMLK